MYKSKKYKSPFAIHPWETVEELLTYQYEERIEKFKNKDITIELAIELSNIFRGIPVKFWTGLQKDYEETVERLKEEK